MRECYIKQLCILYDQHQKEESSIEITFPVSRKCFTKNSVHLSFTYDGKIYNPRINNLDLMNK